MSDILFRYLLAARRRDRSFVRRLFFADEQLLAAGVEQLVESATARVKVTSQHERIERKKETVPASRRHRVRFYDVAQPVRPTEGHFERRSDEFPLSETLQVFTCRGCHGRGKVRCSSCSGRGRVSCSSCGGSGRKMDTQGRSRSCSSCGGDGRRRCWHCGGDGKVTCSSCDGEGQQASWQVEVYRWLVEERQEDEYPLAEDQKTASPQALRRAFERWLDIVPERVESLDPETAGRHLGYGTSQALAVAARAETLRGRLEGEARGSSDRYLFHLTERALAPVGYTVVRLTSSRATYYWLVGRGDQAQEIVPRGVVDGRKCLGWLGLGGGGTLAWDGLVDAYHLALPEVLSSLSIFGDLAPGWLAGGAAAGWLLTLGGVRRVVRHPPPVLTVGLLPASGEPTSWLTCLAYLGSYAGRLTVLDRAYDTQLERLTGRSRTGRQSDSLSVRLADGRRVRLVEVAMPGRLSDGQLELMLAALDGVLVLAEGEREAAELESRLRAIDIGRKTKPPAIGTVAIDRDAEHLDVAGALPLEAIRRAFVEARPEVDWPPVFETMWRPVAELLDAPRRRAESAGVASTAERTLSSPEAQGAGVP